MGVKYADLQSRKSMVRKNKRPGRISQESESGQNSENISTHGDKSSPDPLEI